MQFDVEGNDPLLDPSERQVRSAISALRSYGPKSFASITDAAGNYLQVAGGSQTCLLERRDAAAGRHFRAYRNERSAIFEDGTILAFSGGEMPMEADEWFPSTLVADAFACFLTGADLPAQIHWRDITGTLFDLGN